MFSYSRTLSHYSPQNALIWGLMAFQAGAINVGGFLACHRFVTHTTGFATHFAAEIVSGHYISGFGILSVPIFFLVGTMISAWLVDTRIQVNKLPLYPVIFGLMGLILIVVTGLGIAGHFGEFGSPLNIYLDYFLLAVLSLCAGLQNATVSSAFNSVIRTTHLTGLTTDLGIGLTRILRRTHQVNSRENELLATAMRILIIASFTFGSAFSAFIFYHAQYWGFLIPAAIAMLIWGWSLHELLKRNRVQT